MLINSTGVKSKIVLFSFIPLSILFIIVIMSNTAYSDTIRTSEGCIYGKIKSLNSDIVNFYINGNYTNATDFDWTDLHSVEFNSTVNPRPSPTLRSKRKTKYGWLDVDIPCTMPGTTSTSSPSINNRVFKIYFTEGMSSIATKISISIAGQVEIVLLADDIKLYGNVDGIRIIYKTYESVNSFRAQGIKNSFPDSFKAHRH